MWPSLGLLHMFGAAQFSSVAQSCPTRQPHGQQHARPPCPSPTPRAYSNSCPLSQLYHPTISSSVVPFSSHLQSFPASGSFLMSQLFPSGGESIGASASASVLPMNIQRWFPLGYIFTYIFFFRFFSIRGYYRILHIVPCAIQCVLVICFICSNVFLFIPNS